MSRTAPSVSKVSPAIDAADPLALPRGCSNLKLRQVDRVVSRHYDRHLAEVGLKTSQYALLGHIAALMPVQPALLAARLQVEPSTLTRNLQPLVAQGWVRVEAGRDARSRQVSLTEAGRLKHAEARSAWKAAQTAFNERLGPQRVAALHALLDECLQQMAEPSQA
jgi:DNA-binding MarR family transcriptional regulator